MTKADAVLAEIYAIVGTWEEPVEGGNRTWSKQEWELAKDIRERLFAEGKRQWGNNPPWDEN